MEGGERAVSNFESGKAGLEARGFRGLGVFTSMPVREPAQRIHIVIDSC